MGADKYVATSHKACWGNKEAQQAKPGHVLRAHACVLQLQQQRKPPDSAAAGRAFSPHGYRQVLRNKSQMLLGSKEAKQARLLHVLRA
jgi:hypothetical protein